MIAAGQRVGSWGKGKEMVEVVFMRGLGATGIKFATDGHRCDRFQAGFSNRTISFIDSTSVSESC